MPARGGKNTRDSLRKRRECTTSKRSKTTNSCNTSKENIVDTIDLTKDSPLPERDRIRGKETRSIGDCAICFEELGTNDLCATRCGHVFCLCCLTQYLEWERSEPRCPTCRMRLKGRHPYHKLYLGRSCDLG